MKSERVKKSEKVKKSDTIKTSSSKKKKRKEEMDLEIIRLLGQMVSENRKTQKQDSILEPRIIVTEVDSPKEEAKLDFASSPSIFHNISVAQP